jgi:hypothetical protein
MPPDVNAARLHRLVRGLRSLRRWTTVGQSAERHPTARPRRWQAFFRVPRPGVRSGPAIAVTTRFRARSRTFFPIPGIPIPEDPIEASDVRAGTTRQRGFQRCWGLPTNDRVHGGGTVDVPFQIRTQARLPCNDYYSLS